MRFTTTTTFFTLVTVDDEILPGYSASTIPRLGMGVGGGLHVSVYVTAGLFAQPDIHFEFSIRHNNELDVFLSLHVPVAALLSDVTVGQCQSDDGLTLGPLRTFTRKDLDVLSQCSRDDKYTEQLKDADLSDPVALLPQVTPYVNYFRMEVDFSRVFEVPNAAFFKVFGDHPPVAQEIVSEVMARLHSAPKLALTCWFFAESSFAKHWQGMLPKIRNLPPPFAAFLTNVRTNYTDLTYNNLGVVEDEFRPKKPVPAATVFHSTEHRTVTLIAGAAEEQQMVDQNALELIGTPMQAVFVDVFSVWSMMPDDLDVYGVIPVDDHNADLLPEVGDRCSFFPTADFKCREMPANTLTANQISRIVSSVVRACHAGERVADNVEEILRQQIEKAQAKQDNDDQVNRLQSEQPDRIRDAYIQQAGEVLYGLISEPTAEIARQFPTLSTKSLCALRRSTGKGCLRRRG